MGPMKLRLGKQSLSLERPRVMGILNVTPDSFSDGGRFATLDAALEQAAAMVAAGADIIDVGGESTRPGAAEVPLNEELRRVLPVIEAIAATLDVAISIDTSKPEVMTAAVRSGATMINDIFALRRERALETAARLDAAVCLMHMQGTPADMQVKPHYDELPGEVIDFLAARVEACRAAGIAGDRLVVDPGFGFGKSDLHNLRILQALDRFAVMGLPVMVGLSRKRTLGTLSARPPEGRVVAGIAAAVLAYGAGAHIVRTHDVAETVDALNFAVAVREA